MKITFTPKKILTACLLFLFFYSAALTYASMTYVAPSTVQDPLGIPGDYTVGFGTNPNEVLYTNDSNALTSDSSFTRKPTLVDSANQTIANLIFSTSANTADTNNITTIGVDAGLLIDDNFNRVGGSQVGFAGGVTFQGTGTIDTTIGTIGAIINASTGTIEDARALSSGIFNLGGGTITNGFVLYANHIDAIHKYGVYIDADDSINVLRELQLHDQSPLKFFDKDSSNFVAFQAPSIVGTDRTFTLPDAYGSNGDVLTSDGMGGLSWTTFAGGGGDSQTTIVHISSAEILSLFSSPVELLPAPGAGKVIQVTTLIIKKNFVSTPYSGDIYPSIIFNNTPTLYDAIAGMSIDFTSSIINQTPPNGVVVENEPLLFRTVTSDPTGGDGTIDIYITYKILDL
jgi:hypothetical protein